MTKESKIILAIAALVVAGIVGLMMFVNSNQMDAAAIMQRIAPEGSRSYSDGEVQVVEFGDYQCPACGQAHDTVETLKEEYEGRITFIYRHFPLGGHANGRPAVEAAEAAGAQGKFWEMHDLIYRAQQQWSGMGDPTEAFVSYAETLDLNIEKFRSDMLEKAAEEVIEAGQSDGYAVGVTGTPTFFINGKRQSGFDYNTLKNAIEAELDNN